MEVLMIKARLFLGIMLLCIGSYSKGKPAENSFGETTPCRCLIHIEESKGACHLQALKDYEKAFELSFDEQWLEASEAAGAAALLDHNNTRWNIDAKSFLHHVH